MLPVKVNCLRWVSFIVRYWVIINDRLQRTKMGLANAKSKGKKLGNPNLPKDNKIRQEKALKFAETLRPILEGFIARGMTQRGMVAELNKLGIKTRHYTIWRLLQLQIVLKRLCLKTKRSTS